MSATTLIVILHFASGLQIFSWTFDDAQTCRATVVQVPDDVQAETYCVIPPGLTI